MTSSVSLGGDYIVSDQPGILYVVATPIGNIGDISPRAIQVLADVDLVAVEDTRHSGRLLTRLGLKKKLISLHEHNERARAGEIIQALADGLSVALISDAGTPLLSDPGYRLLRALRDAGLTAVPIPGPSALTAALSIAGLPTDRFVFEGFLPSRGSARIEHLNLLLGEKRTLVFYEAPHRLIKTVHDMASVLGSDRAACLARELTKQYETIYYGTLGELAARAEDDSNMARGEMVIVVAGSTDQKAVDDPNIVRLLKELLTELPPAKAARIASRFSGQARRSLYALATQIADDE